MGIPVKYKLLYSYANGVYLPLIVGDKIFFSDYTTGDFIVSDLLYNVISDNNNTNYNTGNYTYIGTTTKGAVVQSFSDNYIYLISPSGIISLIASPPGILTINIANDVIAIFSSSTSVLYFYTPTGVLLGSIGGLTNSYILVASTNNTVALLFGATTLYIYTFNGGLNATLPIYVPGVVVNGLNYSLLNSITSSVETYSSDGVLLDSFAVLNGRLVSLVDNYFVVLYLANLYFYQNGIATELLLPSPYQGSIFTPVFMTFYNSSLYVYGNPDTTSPSYLFLFGPIPPLLNHPATSIVKNMTLNGYLNWRR